MKLEIKAIKFIQLVYKNTAKKLYAGNSGGKDSAVVDKLLQLSGIDYESYYTNTTIDPPGTISHIRKNYPHTQILYPKETFYQLVERKGLPTRLSRYCCEYLKEYASIGKMVFEGIRKEESKKRLGRDYIQCDNRKKQKQAQHIYPIYDWTEKNVYDFIGKYKIILAPHYGNQGCTRLGCVGCPLVSRKRHREKEFEIYPRIYNNIKKSICKGMEKNPQWKLTLATNGDADIAMKWWLSGKTMDGYFSDCEFKKINKVWVKTEKWALFNKTHFNGL
jgi:3'-phosphoadenosine 5'-phosphosulfate sulfotransferase (PAPS reductase)/FAD synthetase